MDAAANQIADVSMDSFMVQNLKQESWECTVESAEIQSKSYRRNHGCYIIPLQKAASTFNFTKSFPCHPRRLYPDCISGTSICNGQVLRLGNTTCTSLCDPYLSDGRCLLRRWSSEGHLKEKRHRNPHVFVKLDCSRLKKCPKTKYVHTCSMILSSPTRLFQTRAIWIPWWMCPELCQEPSRVQKPT